MRSRNTQSGFTLIELLVVISIIGMLSSVVLSSVNSARARARDNAKIQSFIQVRNALELYKSNTGSYPLGDPLAGGYSLHGLNVCPANPVPYIAGIVPNLIPSLPSSGNSSGYCYLYYSLDGSGYMLEGFNVLENDLADGNPFLLKYNNVIYPPGHVYKKSLFIYTTGFDRYFQ